MFLVARLDVLSMWVMSLFKKRVIERRIRYTGTDRISTMRKVGLAVIVMIVILAAAATWVGYKASVVKTELEQAVRLAPQLKQQILSSSDAVATEKTVDELRKHTSTARNAAEDPVWTLASALPWIGPNLDAVRELSRSADDVATLGLAPLSRVYESVNWDSLLPSSSGGELSALRDAAPVVQAAGHAVHSSSTRLENVDDRVLLPQVAAPFNEARKQLEELSQALDPAADAAAIAPSMLGADGSRSYLLIIQNNAEVRASGGIPGALAVLNLTDGKLTLSAQSSAADVGIMDPLIPVAQEQAQIYSMRLGKYMQDVNLTPDFPTAASTARDMWERKTNQKLDGVISIDPVALSYILQATGPVTLTGPEANAAAAARLPTVLSGENVVATLLSDAYAKIQQPKLQDIYFAGVAKEVFAALSQKNGKGKALITGITKSVEEKRALLWSANEGEQAVIAKYRISGSISGPSVAPAEFGVYFNDGTGAKMDYYVKRTVQLVRECPVDEYQQMTVRITSRNTAPADAGKSLPRYVTGGGVFGVAPGTVQTNIIAYGPSQSQVESATVEGQKTPFAPYLHADRPVGVVAQQLAPGESKTVDFTFSKIVQHTQPDLTVTPTIQPVKDVVLPMETASCGKG